MKRIYIVENSNITGLKHVGLMGIAGRQFPVNRNDYWKQVDKFFITVPMIHTDVTTGLFYQYQYPTQVDKWKKLNQSLQPAIQDAVNNQNLDGVVQIEQDIIASMCEITNRSNITEFEANLDSENKNVIAANRRDQLGQTFGDGVKLATEPITRTSQIAQSGITDVGENLSQLTGSPVFLVLLGVAGVVALKVVIK
jgi:hypothetical protein